MLIRRLGGLTVLALSLASCTTVTNGDPAVNASDAPAYRTSVSVSLSESAAASSSRESQRQASVTMEAVHSSCEALASSSSNAIDAVNTYVGAFNKDSGDITNTESPAVDSLMQSAEAVEASITDALPPDLKDAFAAWVDAANRTAQSITAHAPPGEFNQTIGELNDARSEALRLCDETY